MMSLNKSQPPPCGCVLKPRDYRLGRHAIYAAASVRLCVETGNKKSPRVNVSAAASVRLCVETQSSDCGRCLLYAAASVRLCVETSVWKNTTKKA